MRLSALGVLVFLGCTTLYGKDFPEPVLAVDPLRTAERTGIAPGMGGSLEYGYFQLSHDIWDLFYFRVEATPVFVNFGDVFAIGGRYESILMCGPVLPTEGPASIMEFTINAVQFEYALYGAVDLGIVGLGTIGHGSAHLLAEYSRTSQHPFRSQFSQIASDILKTGVTLPRIEFGRLGFSSAIRLGYHDLFDFWKSPLGKPRTEWILQPMLELELNIARGTGLVLRAYPEIILDRYAGSVDAMINLESGLSLARGAERIDLLFTMYGTRNSEMLSDVVHPTLEMGLALRISRLRN
jgi:hypothetical protein